MGALPSLDTSHARATVRAVKLGQAAGGLRPPAPKTVRAPYNPDNWPPNYPQIMHWRAWAAAQFEKDPQQAANARAYYSTHPVDFINHWCDTYDPRNAGTDRLVYMPFVMFQRQEELVEFLSACLAGEAPGLVEKSRDMGATWVCIAFGVWMWLFWPGVAIGWGSRKQELVDRLGDASSIFEKIRMLIGRLPKFLKPANIELKQYACINRDNGATIAGEIGDEIGRGGRTRIYFVDEAAHLEHPELVEAALSENTRVRVDLSSVSGLGTVFHRTREAGVDWAPGQPAIKQRTNVCIMDWSDHPEKTPEWHKARKEHFETKGLPHVFAREIERDYAAAVEGVIIPADWVRAAIDAHTKVEGFTDEGYPWKAALDVADTGQDSNAITARKGFILREVKEWGARDTGVTTRYAIDLCKDRGPMELEYDCVGLGSGVKSEANRLKDDGLFPPTLRLVPWNAGGAVLWPKKRVLTLPNGKEDPDSPRNEEMYANLKAQAWWEVRLRFYRTYQAVEQGEKFDPDDLISIDSKIPLLRKLQKELSQAVAIRNTKLKLLVDKTPEGTMSPNIADSLVMNYWPWIQPGRPRTSFVAPVIINA